MKKSFLALLFISLNFASASRAESLWPGGSGDVSNTPSMISDNRALKVGDLVTVQIIESASAQQSTTLQTSKEASVSGGAGPGSWSKNGGVPVQSFGAGAATHFDGGGQSARSGRIVTTLSARVVSVMDSGNLVIEGRRSLKINEEQQNIYLRGLIRPVDVGRNNTILSSAISDAQIIYEGKGPISEKSRSGVFTRVLDWLGIF